MIKKIKNLFYWLRTHTYNKYHLIDCRSPHNGYDWGWYDRDGLILFACFNILKGFVEKENWQMVDWNHDEERKAVLKEILDLYAWWDNGRAAEHKLVMDEASAAFKNHRSDSKERLEIAHKVEGLDTKDNEMLLRLMKIRCYLWT